MPKQEEPVIGKGEIGDYYKKLVADPNFVPLTLRLNWNSFHVVGDIAITTAVFDGGVTRNGKQIHFRVKDLVVWRKQRDNSWKILRYMYDEIPAKEYPFASTLESEVQKGCKLRLPRHRNS